jgi:hypothetical protein
MIGGEVGVRRKRMELQEKANAICLSKMRSDCLLKKSGFPRAGCFYESS